MLETYLARLEEKSFGVPEFRKHVHRIDGTTVTEDGHSHRVGLVTGPPWPSPKGHRHRILGVTSDAKPSHSHDVRGWTSPSRATDLDHSHDVNLRTRAVQNHSHEIHGATATLARNRSIALRSAAHDGVSGD